MEIQTEVTLDSGTCGFCFSLKTQRYTMIDDMRQNIGEPHRISVSPGDIAVLEQLLGQMRKGKSMVDHPITAMCRALWTPEVIAEFRVKCVAEENVEDASTNCDMDECGEEV
jgi:hypothetical protein